MKQYWTPNTSGKNNTKEFIILHHTATGRNTRRGVVNGFMGARVASAHYLIDENGNVDKFNTDSDVLRHAGKSKRLSYYGLNNYAIGIEIIGPLPGFTKKQKSRTRGLVKSLMQEYDIQKQNVLRHKDISPGRKIDIEDTFWDTEYPTYGDYQNSLIPTKNKMTEEEEEEEEMLVISLMNLNSTLYNNIDDKKVKDLMSKVNTRYRELGFDNK